MTIQNANIEDENYLYGLVFMNFDLTHHLRPFKIFLQTYQNLQLFESTNQIFCLVNSWQIKIFGGKNIWKS